jgi:hypothetical protein
MRPSTSTALPPDPSPRRERRLLRVGIVHGRRIVVQDEDGGTSDVDVDELEREIEQSMKEAQEQAEVDGRNGGDLFVANEDVGNQDQQADAQDHEKGGRALDRGALEDRLHQIRVGEERHRRRLEKVKQLERRYSISK